MPPQAAELARRCRVGRRDRLPFAVQCLPWMRFVGNDGFTSEVMHGVVAPAGTPDEVVRRVNAAFVKVLSDKNIQERFLANSCVAMPGTPAQYAQAIAAEFDQWQAVIRKSGIKME